MMISNKEEQLSPYEQGLACAEAYTAGEINVLEAAEVIRAQLSVEPCIRLLDYWKNRMSEGALPLIDDIDMTELPDLIPYMYRASFDEAAQDWRLEYVGRDIVKNYPEEPTGKFLSELVSGDVLVRRLEKYAVIRKSKLPIFQFLDQCFFNKNYLDAHDLTVPVRASKDTDHVTHVIGLLFFPTLV